MLNKIQSTRSRGRSCIHPQPRGISNKSLSGQGRAPVSRRGLIPTKGYSLGYLPLSGANYKAASVSGSKSFTNSRL